MAYPTGVSFKHRAAPMGAQPIHEASTTQKHELGLITRAFDYAFGEGEFIYLAGAASTAQGDLVAYNSKTGATTRAEASVAGASEGPVAIAASANLANQYGWYQISGSCPVASATGVTANADVYLSATAGTVDHQNNLDSLVSGAVFKAAVSGGYATVQLNRPSVDIDAATATLVAVETDGQSALAGISSVYYVELSAAAEAGNAIVVSGQVKTGIGSPVAQATPVVFRSLAVTDGKGDLTVTVGTSKKVVNPATGENVAWLVTDATGAFSVSVANDVAEQTLVTAQVAEQTISAAGGLTLTFT